MGKSKHQKSKADKEYTKVQRLQAENAKLKRQISSLRKQLSRIDIDQYQNLRELVEAHAKQDLEFDKESGLESLKKRWECRVCKGDYLRLVIVPRLDGTFYFRKCGTCTNRTKLKLLTDDIEGITSNDKIFKKENGRFET